MIKNLNLDKIYQLLLIILAFLLPLTVFGANLIIVIICVLWLFSGNYKSKFDQIISSKLMLASILFFCLHLAGLLWTDDLEWGLHIVHKMWYFIGLFPILFTLVQKDYIKYYISAYLIAISISEMISYLIWFELIQPFKYATVEDPTALMSHISYNPLLAIAIYIVYHEILYNTRISFIKRFIYCIFSISMTINMFITGGRAGQVMFFAMIAILIFQYFHTHKLKAALLTIIITLSIFFTAFQTSPIFESRALDVIDNITYYDLDKNTSVGHRISFTINSWEIIQKNLLIGVGTGDFPTEYKLINNRNTPELDTVTNPHNMYVLILTQIGIIGLTSFLLIFYFQIRFALVAPNQFQRNLGLTLPLLFLLIMWSDSYLLGHYTSLLYIFLSSFLYKDFEKT
jgi:O-antigen ligase